MTEQPQRPSRFAGISNRRRAVYAFLASILIGPPIGGISVMLGLALASLVSGDANSGESALCFLAAIPVVAIFSYIAGGLQALVCGLILAVPVARTGHVGLGLTAGVAGFVGMLRGGAVLFAGETIVPAGLLFVAPALVSAIGCRAFLLWLGVLRRQPRRE